MMASRRTDRQRQRAVVLWLTIIVASVVCTVGVIAATVWLTSPACNAALAFMALLMALAAALLLFFAIVVWE